MKWLTNIFNKEVTWLKINKWDVNLFWWSSDLLYFRFNVFQYKMSRFFTILVQIKYKQNR